MWAGLDVCSEIPEVGDSKPIDFMGLPLFIIRDTQNVVRVFQNTCRHRGMILVEQTKNIQTIIRSASDTGALYGSVTPRDAADAANEAGFTIDRKQFTLKSPIKELGLHEIEIKLHPEVSASVIVNVARSLEEAIAHCSQST